MMAKPSQVARIVIDGVGACEGTALTFKGILIPFCMAGTTKTSMEGER
jgi:hypothetical protein